MSFRKNLWYFLPVSLFLISIYITATVPINSYDFWWDLKTGEYLIQFKTIPEIDPFTYTADSDDPFSPGRPHFLLSQYWLAQVIFALIVKSFGLKGFIVFRGIIYVAIAFTALLLILMHSSLRMAFIPIFFFILSTNVALEDADRPQFFSFLWALLVVLIIEWSVEKKLKWLPFLSVPVMLFASNMHAGYLIGLIYVVVYLLCVPFEDRLKDLKKPLLLSGILTCLITYFNPNQWQAVRQVFSLMQPTQVTTFLEWKSPIEILPYVYSNAGWISYWGLIVLGIPAIYYYFRKRRYSWAILLFLTMTLSLIAMRFIYFFIPICTVFVSVLFKDTLLKKIRKRILLEVFIATILLFLTIIINRNSNMLGVKKLVLEELYPIEAAEFMARENLPQSVFNNINWGGYLEWRLWPKYKMFIDTRVIMTKTYSQYADVMSYNIQGKNMLEDYKINTIITPAIDQYTGEIIPLVRALYKDPDWSLIYHDGVSQIFVRKGFYPGEIAKYNVYYEVLLEIQNWRHLFPWAQGYERSVKEAVEELKLK